MFCDNHKLIDGHTHTLHYTLDSNSHRGRVQPLKMIYTETKQLLYLNIYLAKQNQIYIHLLMYYIIYIYVCVCMCNCLTNQNPRCCALEYCSLAPVQRTQSGFFVSRHNLHFPLEPFLSIPSALSCPRTHTHLVDRARQPRGRSQFVPSSSSLSIRLSTLQCSVCSRKSTSVHTHTHNHSTTRLQ